MQQGERKLYITPNWVRLVFFYYCVLFGVGLYFTISTLLFAAVSLDVIKDALIGSIAISVCASSIFYIRKLYKLCFSYASEQENDDQIQLKRLGTLFYFFTRPIFAVLFSILVVIGFSSGMNAAAKSTSLEVGFVYLTMFFSFYVGFLSGAFIKKLEKDGTKKLDKIVG